MKSQTMENTMQLTPLSKHSDDVVFKAIAERNAAFDGRVFYAVKTTGIYCHPSCPSRAAKRQNMVLYESREAAERSGFRACKRCKPDRLQRRASYSMHKGSL